MIKFKFQQYRPILTSTVLKIDEYDADLEWKAIHRVADANVTRIENFFISTIKEFRKTVDIDKIAVLINSGDYFGTEVLIDWLSLYTELTKMYELSLDVLNDSGKVAAKYFERFYNSISENKIVKLELNMMFDIKNPASEQWAKQHVGTLITEVTEETKRGVREVITHAFKNGGHPYVTARKIRNFVGLKSRDMKALLNYQDALDLEGLSIKQVDKMVDTYTTKLLNRRAKTIARTETINSACAGQEIHWKDMAGKGYIDRNRHYKEWIITPDDRLCPECAAMDGEKVPLDGNFSGGVSRPTLHVLCRCAMGLAEIKEPEYKAEEAEWAFTPAEQPPISPSVKGQDISSTFQFTPPPEPTLDWSQIKSQGDLELWQVRVRESQSSALAAIHAQGFDGLPTILPKNQFYEYSRQTGQNIAYRGIAASTPEKLSQYTQAFQFGDFYIAENGAHGSGLYATYTRSVAETYTKNAANGHVYEMMFKPDTKFISLTDVREKCSGVFSSLDDGTKAAIMGYDVIISPHELTVLNRTAIILKGG